jgi:hypothetical protein
VGVDGAEAGAWSPSPQRGHHSHIVARIILVLLLAHILRRIPPPLAGARARASPGAPPRGRTRHRARPSTKRLAGESPSWVIACLRPASAANARRGSQPQAPRAAPAPAIEMHSHVMNRRAAGLGGGSRPGRGPAQQRQVVRFHDRFARSARLLAAVVEEQVAAEEGVDAAEPEQQEEEAQAVAKAPAKPKEDPEVLLKQLKQEVARRRNFAIISHPDAGKTTLVRLLRRPPPLHRPPPCPAAPLQACTSAPSAAAQAPMHPHTALLPPASHESRPRRRRSCCCTAAPSTRRARSRRGAPRATPPRTGWSWRSSAASPSPARP